MTQVWRRLALCAVPAVVYVLSTGCGVSPPTPTPTAVDEISCEGAEQQLDVLMQNMLLQLGVGPQFTSRNDVPEPELIARFNDIQRRTPAARNQFSRLEVLWERADGALQHFLNWKHYKQGRSLNGAISQANAGIALSGQRMVCEPP